MVGEQLSELAVSWLLRILKQAGKKRLALRPELCNTTFPIGKRQ
jgi:hypothetical protein